MEEFPGETRVAAYAVIEQQGRLLLSWFNGSEQLWTLPGGGVEWGETLHEGLIREVYEETGYRVEIGEHVLTGMHYWAEDLLSSRGLPGRTMWVVHRARVVGGTLGTVEVGGSTDRAEWIDLADLPHQPHGRLVAEIFGTRPGSTTP